MGTRGLPDIYTLSPRACGPRALGVYIRQATRAHVTTIYWYSNPFYTHNKGYKMHLHIDAAGHDDGKGTHLSVFLYLMKGPHDDELTWPLKGKIEIKLLNQTSNSEHLSKILPYDDDGLDDYNSRVIESRSPKQGWGWSRYISNENLNKITPRHRFLKDDCLFFQVTKL